MTQRFNFEQTALTLLLAIAALAPVPFASNRPWAWSLLSALSGIALALWFVHVRQSGGRPMRYVVRLLPASIPFLLAILYAFLQIVPWTPRAWHNPLWAQTAAYLDAPYHGMISLDGQSTLDDIMRLMGYGALFVLAWGLGLARDQARRILKVLLWTITACAAYGLLVQFLGLKSVLWFHKWAYLDYVTGPFINRNNFATYVGFGLIICSVLLFARLKPALNSDFSRMEMATRLMRALFAESWAYLVAGAVLLTALVLTGSRAGVGSTVLGLLTVGTMLVLREASRRTAPLLLVVSAGLAVIAILFLSGEEVIDRALDTSFATEERQNVYALTMTGISDRLWSGHGLGTFDPAFAMYRDAALQHSWDKAHNVYLETMFELGVPAALLLFLAVGWVAASCARGYFLRHRDRNYTLAATGCTVIAIVHSAFDFSLQIPAVAATFAMLLGVGFAQAFATERQRA